MIISLSRRFHSLHGFIHLILVAPKKSATIQGEKCHYSTRIIMSRKWLTITTNTVSSARKNLPDWQESQRGLSAVISLHVVTSSRPWVSCPMPACCPHRQWSMSVNCIDLPEYLQDKEVIKKSPVYRNLVKNYKALPSLMAGGYGWQRSHMTTDSFRYTDWL